jgi:4-hydroxy 2-oxovalerate aldolase
MINAAEYLSTPDPVKAIKKYFSHSNKSRISLVRVAINFNNFYEAKILTETLNSLGYKVGLNLMQAHEKEEKEYTKIAKKIREWNSVDVLYFADSFGSMEPDEIEKIIASIKKAWDGDLGIHTHDNKGFGLINSMKAVSCGANWIDCTITGMGRGAGNTSTENLQLELSGINLHEGDPLKLQKTRKNFDILREEYKWGKNMFYQFAANNSIHPTYVQTLMNDTRYDEDQIFDVLKSLAGKVASSFDENKLKEAIYVESSNSYKGSWDPSGWMKGKTVLLIGAGESVKKYKDYLIKLAKQKEIEVFFLNINNVLPNEIATATIVSHVSRAVLDLSFYDKLKMLLILPLDRLKNLIDNTKDMEILDYGLILEENKFEFEKTFCKLDTPLVSAYALGIMYLAQAKEIYLAGFDGYDLRDDRNDEMEEVLKQYQKLKGHPKITSITPTSYINLHKSSLFSPEIL